MLQIRALENSASRPLCRTAPSRNHPPSSVALLPLVASCSRTMRPAVSAQQAEEMASQHWGLSGRLEVSELAGYDDRNWRVAGATDAGPWEAA